MRTAGACRLLRQYVYEDFLPPPDSFWSPVSVTARPFWCTPHPHRVFAWTFLSALSPPPQLPLSGTWAYHLPGFWGTVSFPLAFLLVSAPLTEPRPFPGGPLQLQERSEWSGRGWCSGSWVLPRTARDQGSGNQCACLGFCLRLPPSQLLPAQETQLSLPLGSPPIAPRVPKDSVLTTGLISRFLIALYLSTSHTLKAETLLLGSSLLLPRPLPKLRPKSMFFKRYD